MSDLTFEVTKFKQWAASLKGTFGEWECDYDRWNDLYIATKAAIVRHKSGEIPDDIADELVYAIARDNESEHLREQLLDTPNLLAELARRVISSRDRDAKWQIAVSVG